jgi:hypothetical protein
VSRRSPWTWSWELLHATDTLRFIDAACCTSSVLLLAFQIPCFAHNRNCVRSGILCLIGRTVFDSWSTQGRLSPRSPGDFYSLQPSAERRSAPRKRKARRAIPCGLLNFVLAPLTIFFRSSSWFFESLLPCFPVWVSMYRPPWRRSA